MAANKKPDDSAVRSLKKRTAELHRAMDSLERDFQELVQKYRQLNNRIYAETLELEDR